MAIGTAAADWKQEWKQTPLQSRKLVVSTSSPCLWNRFWEGEWQKNPLCFGRWKRQGRFYSEENPPHSGVIGKSDMMAQTETNAHNFQACSMCKKISGGSCTPGVPHLMIWAGHRDTEVPTHQYWYQRRHLDVTCSPEGSCGTISMCPLWLSLYRKLCTCTYT